MPGVEELITEHIDVWTSAIKRKSSAGRGVSKKIELYGVKKLRALILDLAVRGLLVPQDSSDEPSAVLIEKLDFKRNALLEEGVIKKHKKLDPVSEEEKPYSIPTGWSWVRLQDVGHSLGQEKPDSEFTYIDVGAINKNLGSIESPSILSASEAPSRARKIVKFGTVIYSTVRPYLRNIAVIDRDFHPAPIASTAFAILHPLEGISGDYLYRYLRCPFFVSYVESVQTGIAYPAINDKLFLNAVIPIPPTVEQHRIVAKVDELMALCDQLELQTESSITAHQTLVETLLGALTQSTSTSPSSPTQLDSHQATSQDTFEQAWQRIAEHFDTLFTTEQSVELLKQSILQLAVMGKLVPQDPDDEPASELLKRIAVEKAELVEAKVIKKQKALPEIGEEEKPFELPVGWEWSRISSMSLVGTGATPSRDNSTYFYPQELAWVTSGETSQEFITETKELVSKKATQETNVSIYPPGTLIVAMYGQGKTRGQVTELKIAAGTNQACAAIQLIELSESHRAFIKLFFRKSYDELRSHAAGGAQPNLNVGKIASTVVPVPPLPEQNRIVSKVVEIMAVCDQINARLADSKKTQLQLADTITEQAIS